MYAPGSTFKVITSSSAIENGLDNMVVEDQGSIVIDGKKMNNFGGEVLGTLGIKSALAFSSNVYFAQMGVKLGENNLKNITSRFYFNKDIPFDLPLNQSKFPYNTMRKTDMASAAIGQGKVLVTPLQMAMVASCIANDGIMMKPVLVREATSHDGNNILSNAPQILSKVMDPSVAKTVTNMMEEVVNSGTGTNAAIDSASVAGKTGTAENELSTKESGKEHAWFIGFAPAEQPEIAVAVICEYNGNTGGTVAAPIARDIMASWLEKNR